MKTRFIIHKGSHYSHLLPRFHYRKDFIRFKFRFSAEDLYTVDGVDKYDINKLYGLGFGFNHHINSFRFGWNCEKHNGKIQLFSYYYNDGVRKWEYLCDVDVDKTYDGYIYFDRAENKVFCNVSCDYDPLFGVQKSYDFSFMKCRRWGFYLYPYFGGNLKAMQKFSIFILNY